MKSSVIKSRVCISFEKWCVGVGEQLTVAALEIFWHHKGFLAHYDDRLMSHIQIQRVVL